MQQNVSLNVVTAPHVVFISCWLAVSTGGGIKSLHDFSGDFIGKFPLEVTGKYGMLCHPVPLESGDIISNGFHDISGKYSGHIALDVIDSICIILTETNLRIKMLAYPSSFKLLRYFFWELLLL
jgi:hypothetical protein